MSVLIDSSWRERWTTRNGECLKRGTKLVARGNRSVVCLILFVLEIYLEASRLSVQNECFLRSRKKFVCVAVETVGLKFERRLLVNGQRRNGKTVTGLFKDTSTSKILLKLHFQGTFHDQNIPEFLGQGPGYERILIITGFRITPFASDKCRLGRAVAVR